MQWVVWITISFPARENTLLRQTSCCWQNGNDNKAMVTMKLDCKEASSEKNSVGDSCVCKSLDGPVPILSLQLILFPGQLVMMPARCAFQMCRWNCLSPSWLDKCTCSLSTFRALWGTWARYSETPLVATARWHLSTCSGPIFDPPAVTMTR